MTEIPHQWQAYYACQAELDQRSDTSSKTCGIEAGLNLLLDDLSLPPEDLKRAISSAARRSRYADALIAKYMRVDANLLDGVAVMEARSTVENIQMKLPSATVTTLLGAAYGEASQHMAARLGVSVATLQTRLSRGRSAARRLAA